MFLCQIIFSLHPHPLNLDLCRSVFLLRFKALLASSGFKHVGALPLSNQPGYRETLWSFLYWLCQSAWETQSPSRDPGTSVHFSVPGCWSLESVCPMTAQFFTVETGVYCLNFSGLDLNCASSCLSRRRGKGVLGEPNSALPLKPWRLWSLQAGSRSIPRSPVGDCQGQLSIDM